MSLNSPAAILANDFVLLAGSSVLDAFDRLEVLESTAEAVIKRDIDWKSERDARHGDCRTESRLWVNIVTVVARIVRERAWQSRTIDDL